MLARLTSLRLWLVVAMLSAALVGLAGAYLSYGRIQASQERASDRAKDSRTAAAIAAQAAAGADRARFSAMQAALPYDQLIVIRDGKRQFAGPPPVGGELELSLTVPFRGGRVILRDYESAKQNDLVALTLVAAGVILLVILAALAAATLVTRAVREPIERAVAAADRLAGGDLSARMGTSGPEELVRLAQAFDSMAERLESAERDQRQFLADVAHEIATPTNAISGYGIALADGSVRGEAERIEARSLIESETRRLTGMIEDLRALTRLDLTEEVRHLQLDLATVGQAAAARFLPIARAQSVELGVDVRHAPVEADERLLGMVLDNLLSNAIRYTPAGGRIDLRVRRRGHELVVAVRDTGVGIAPEHQRRVFDRLYRVAEARDRASGGTGLGLAIAQRAARALGGRLELESELGRGSEFRLVLPDSGRRRGGGSRTGPASAKESQVGSR
ncbi:MAG: two-component system, OmpR family, sensor histidine kinase BaeS [Gaiellaceae bacterium]|nr:two-component system, OmpR family, sensor histidine kinase BaeS [Gaiellaceae bacterium]